MPCRFTAQVATLSLSALLGGCATSPHDRAWVSRELQAVAAPLGPEDAEGATLPPGTPETGELDESTAVAIALWNSAAFQADLAQLGVSRADLAEAGALPNPTFSMLMPLGPRTIEVSLLMPLMFLWQRPARVAAARLQVEQVARGLVQNGLDLARDVRVAHAEWVLAEGRREAREQLALLWGKTAALVEARFAAGDASQMELAAIRAEALTAVDAASRARTDTQVAWQRLRLLMGVVQTPLLENARPRVGSPEARSPRPLEQLMPLALAARPDVRAAELGLEGAGKRLGWEKARILNLLARLDAKPTTTASGNVSLWVPGAQLEVPLFNWNQGGVGRAEAELSRASARYLLLRQQVATEVLTSREQLLQASQSLQAFQTHIVPALTASSDGALQAFEAGELPYLQVLEALRRLTDARFRTLDLEADFRRALAQLDRGLGKQGASLE